MTKLKEDFEASGGVFKEWRIGDLFVLKSNPQLDKDNFVFSDNARYPYFTRTVFNNGIFGRVEFFDNEHLIKGNSIAVGMMGMQFFYMRDEFYAGQFTKTAYPKFPEFNERIALYFISLLNRFQKKYLGVLVRHFEETFYNTEVFLPTFNNEPSYSYMEQYITMLEEEKMLQVDKFLKDSGLNDTTLTAEETAALEKFRNDEVKFEERKIGDLFSCKTGDVDVQRCHLNGKGTIYINSGVTDLGIIGKTDMKARIFPANTITIDMFGNAYYRDFEYKMATHAHVFSLSHLDDKLNKENGLYICASLGYFTQLFSFNDMCNWSKMKDKKVCLPQRQDGDIDYTFMQHFISALEKLVMRGVVKYKDDMLNANLKTYSFGTDCYNVAAEPNLQNK